MSENKRTNADCAIVGDLLPLYVEGMTSEGSNEFVKEHLSRCRECRFEAEKLNAPQLPADDPAVPMKRLRQTLLRRRLALTVLAVGLVCVLVFAAYARLTKRHYLRYDEAVAYCEGGGGELSFRFTDELTGFERTEERLGDGSVRHNIQAWYTLLDRLRGKRTDDSVSVRYVTDRPLSGKSGRAEADPYTGEPGGFSFDASGAIFSEIRDDRPFGESFSIRAGRTELCYSIAPSASLLPIYAAAAACALAVLLLLAAVVLFLIKKDTAARLVLRLILLPLSFVFAYLLVNGFRLWSHTPSRDLLMSGILAALIAAFTLGSVILMPRRRG